MKKEKQQHIINANHCDDWTRDLCQCNYLKECKHNCPLNIINPKSVELKQPVKAFEDYHLSKEAIIIKMVDIMPYSMPDECLNYIYEAMQIYADQQKTKFIQVIKDRIEELKIELKNPDRAMNPQFIAIRILELNHILNLLQS